MAAAPRDVSWALVYATADAPLSSALRAITQQYPNAAVFGATSSRGVFGPQGFTRGVQVLYGEHSDGVRASAQLRACSARTARSEGKAAASAIERELGRKPDALLLQATPGFEERILEGISDAFDGDAPPVYGGSAADDAIAGEWRIFLGTRIEREGFVLIGFTSEHPISGAFVSGYTPTQSRARVTRAQGRVVYELDGAPAARVYNRWIGGALDRELEAGGVVLGATTLHPVGRIVDKVGAVPRYLLSHPHEVFRDGSMSFFTDMAVGDELVLMLGTEASLVERADQVFARARRGAEGPLAGVILTYCGGCVAAIGDGTAKLAEMFRTKIGDKPFLGAATFGEQGCFVGPKPVNRHGNLMCNAILFEGPTT